MDYSWINTIKALQDFASILICGKCGCKPISPVRLTNCGHFFCHNCVKFATICVKCEIPVQPREINPDCFISNLIQGCDTIAKIIKRENVWNNIGDISVAPSVSEILSTPRKQFYIKNKKNINKPNAKGETQLHTTCLKVYTSKGNAEQVKQLLLAGANPNTKDNAGWTPLQEMINYGCIEISKLLLSCGALPNISGYDQKTPLHEAVENDRIEEAKLLLDYHADKNLCDRYGKKPIDYCKSDQMRQLLINVQSEQILDTSINQTLDSSLYAKCGKLVIYPSNLKPENQKLLSLIAAKHKLKILTTYRSSVTHVIVEVNERNVTKLTLDVLFTIVHGNWLLNSEWIKLAEDIDDISNLDFELFEVNGVSIPDVSKKARRCAENQNPRLFNNCSFYFALQADTTYQIGDLKLKKDDLIRLVKAGEGTIFSREPNPEDLKDMTQMIPFHTASDSSHPLYKCTHYIIYMPGKGEPRIKYNMPHIKSLPLIWLIECIEKFTLVNPTHLGLS